MTSPFENKCPAHIQRSLSSPNKFQPTKPRSGKASRHRASADQPRSLTALPIRHIDPEQQNMCKSSSIPLIDSGTSTSSSTLGAERASSSAVASTRAP